MSKQPFCSASDRPSKAESCHKPKRKTSRAFKLGRVAVICAAVVALLSVAAIRAWAVPVSIDAEHFPDNAFRAFVSENFDVDKDGTLSTDEIDAAEDITINDPECVSLEGIEYLSELVHLSYGSYYNDVALLPSLDLSKNKNLVYVELRNLRSTLEVSDLPKLETLDLGNSTLETLIVRDCGVLESINFYQFEAASIKISNLPVLVQFEINSYANGAVASLEVSNLPALEYLICSDTGLASLTLDNLPSLTALYCPGEDQQAAYLTSLDLSACPKLEELYCQGNQLTSLDLSNNPALTTLSCGQNRLSSLDLSNNPALVTLECLANQLSSLDLSNNPALSELDCSANRLSSLDVSNNTSLESLFCDYNRLTTIDLSKLSSLRNLSCNGNQLSSLDVSKNLALEIFSCDFNFLTSLDLSNNTQLSDWPQPTCAGNRLLDVVGWDEGFGYYYGSGQKVVIPVSADPTNPGSYISDESYPLGTHILTVNDSSVSYDPTTGRFVVPAGKLNTPLGFLTQFNPAVQYDLEGIIRFEAQPASPIGVRIDEANFPDPAFQARVRVDFDLDGNGWLSPDEANVVGAMDVGGNEYTSLTGIEHFPELLRISVWDTSLTSLDLSNNSKLEELDCGANRFTSLDVSGLPALERLNCAEGSLTSLTLGTNPVLEELYCYDNRLVSLDASNLPSLKWLACYDNRLTSLTVGNNPALTELLCQDNRLTSLDLSGLSQLQMVVCGSNRLFDVTGLPSAVNNFAAGGEQVTIPVSPDPNNPGSYISDASYPLGTHSIAFADTAVSHDPATGKFTTTKVNVSIEFETTIESSEIIEGYIVFTNTPSVPPIPTGIPIDDVHFPDPTFRAFVQTRFDLNDNWWLSSDEADTVTEISVSGAASLQGIEYFPELEELDCRDVTSLDLSNNPKLNILVCIDGGLSSLDVSNNPLLRMLVCNNNSLSSLDLSNNPELAVLYCDSNDLTALDLSNNPELGILHAWDNGLTTLDLSNNLKLEQLDCGSNQLTSLNLGNNPVLFDLQLAINRLTSLDVSQLPALETLRCSDNQLTALDVSNNTALEGLMCDGNELTALDVSNNNLLRTFWCHENQLLDVTGSPSNVADFSADDQTVTIPVSADPNNLGSYISDATYPLGTHTIALSDPSVNYDPVTGRFTVPTPLIQTDFETSAGPSEKLTGTITFTGVLAPPTTYTVTFVDFDGTVLSTQTVAKGDAAVAPTQPSRTGYTFIGWDLPFDNITADITVTAQYDPREYAIEFMPGTHGTTPPYTADFVKHGTLITVPGVPPGEAGWVFDGWLVGGAVTGLMFPGDTFIITGHVGMIAQWKPATPPPPTTYTVTFVDSDGTVLSTQTVAEGDAAVAPTPPSRVGSNFVGWDKAFNNVTSDLVVTAQYEHWQCAIEYEPGTHGTNPPSIADFINYGALITVPKTPPGEAGWVFDGWLASGAITGLLFPGDTFVITGHVTLTAQWKPATTPPPSTYTVTFRDFDGSTLANVTVAAGGTATPPVPPARAGYSFVGWDGSITNVTSNITVTAVWAQEFYTVSFLPGTRGNFSVVVVSSLPYGAPTPQAPVPSAQAGWAFDGWSPTVATTVTGNATYTAQWRQVQSSTPTPTPQPQPGSTVIINNPAPTPTTTYVTTTSPSTQQSSSQTTDTTQQEAADTQDDSTALPDTETPLDSGEKDKSTNIWLIISLLIFLLVVFLATFWLASRRRRRDED